MQSLERGNSSSSLFKSPSVDPNPQHCYEFLAECTGLSHRMSINSLEILYEVLTSLHIDLNYDLVRLIDLYMYGITHPFDFHEREEDFQILSLDFHPSLRSLKPDAALKMLVGRTLYGFEICDDRYAQTNPCEIMTNEGSIFLVPLTFATWWLNCDNKCIYFPARYGFNHRIEDARMIIRTTGPHLQLLVSPCQNEGSRLGAHWSLSLEVDDNLSFTEDSIGAELLKAWDGSSQENTMVFLSQKRNSLILGDKSSDIADNLIISEPVNEPREMLTAENQRYSPSSRILGEPLECTSECWSDKGRMSFHLESNILKRQLSREVTPEPSIGEHYNDMQSLRIPNERSRTKDSHLTPAKSYILELGAGSLREEDLSLSFRNKRSTSNPKYN